MIKIEFHNSDWARQFEKEAKLIQNALGENCIFIHHIGSTAINKLESKPIIDIMVVVRNLLEVDNRNVLMQDIGYEIKGECGILFRRFFIKRNSQFDFNIHVFQEGNSVIDKHLLFRDWLRSHPKDREKYGHLKQTLIKNGIESIEDYLQGKDEFVTQIIKKTGYNGLRIVRPLMKKEWDAVYRMREKFDNKQTEKEIFTHPDHWHFILNQGVDIVGYAHIQRITLNKVIIKILIIDDAYQNDVLGIQFFTLLEKWLKEQEIEILIDSNLKIDKF